MPRDASEPRTPRYRRFEDIRFYVDEDRIGLGLAMMWARADTVACGETLVAENLHRGILDVDWIPIVANHGWVAITGNWRIRRNPVEAAVCEQVNARIICLHDPRGDQPTWGWLCQLARHWERVERFVHEHPHGPWWLSVPPSGPQELPFRTINSRTP